MATDIYALSDKAISRLARISKRLFRQAEAKLSAIGIDELNVRTVMNELYRNLYEENVKAFLILAKSVYKLRKGKDDPDRSWVLALLDEYNSVTLYIYDNEVHRKRERTIEAILGIQKDKKRAPVNRPLEFKRALALWDRMTKWGCDNIAYHAQMKSFEDTGVKQVMWMTERDEKVCGKCSPLDGNVYDIKNVPPPQHPNCRCRLVPVN